MPTFVYPASATVGVSVRRRSLAARRALRSSSFSRRLSTRDAASCEAAVGLELRLAGAARADAAAEALEVLPHPAHPRQVVLELRELDLELSLGARPRAGRRCRGSAACGRRRACRARPRGSAAAPGSSSSSTSRLSASASRNRSFSSSSLPLPTYVRCAGRARCCTTAADRLDARGPRELLDLGELVVGVCSLCQHREDEPALGLGRTWNHEPRLCPLAPRIRSSRSARSSSSTSPRESREEAARLRVRDRRTCRSRPSFTTTARACSTPSAAGKPLVLLAGHTDTVPAQGNIPGRIEDGCGRTGSARRT